MALFVGGLAALVCRRIAPSWTKRFLVAIGAGIVAGDTLHKTGDVLVRAIGQLF